MSIELTIPDVGESIQEVHIGEWLKKEGDVVERDEDVVQLETDKASMELPAPVSGVLKEILHKQGDMVAIGDVIGRFEESDVSDATAQESQGQEGNDKNGQGERDEKDDAEPKSADQSNVPFATPSGRRALKEHGLTADDVTPEGERIRRQDVERHVEETSEETSDTVAESSSESGSHLESELEEVVPLSFLRRRIAERLVAAQQKAALLSTFNEIDMSAVVELRQEYGDRFESEYGVDLGYMPFFVKAVIDALGSVPELNAELREVDGDESIVYRNYHHIGIAVGGGEGLVVPVMRFAERMSFAEIEESIHDFAQRAKSKELQPNELQDGTFTITNGGVYGSLLSTPIVNPPQSGVLGMHAIEDRPIAVNGEVVIRPMMYVALTYDHRVVDGREAVLFLKRVKDVIESPARMLLEV